MNAIDHLAPEVIRILAAASIKSVLLLSIAGALSLLMRRNSGATRHLIWTLAVAGALALPVVERFVPEWRFAVLPTRAVPATIPIEKAAPVRIRPADTFLARATVERAPGGSSPETKLASGSSAPPIPSHDAAPSHIEPAPLRVARHPIELALVLVWSAGLVALGTVAAAGAIVVRWTARRGTLVKDGHLWVALNEMRLQLGIKRRRAPSHRKSKRDARYMGSTTPADSFTAGGQQLVGGTDSHCAASRTGPRPALGLRNSINGLFRSHDLLVQSASMAGSPSDASGAGAGVR